MREKEDGLTGRVNSSNAGLTYSVYWWRTWSRSRPRSLMSLSTVFVCVIVIPRGAENNLIYQGGIIPGGHYTRGALYQEGIIPGGQKTTVCLHYYKLYKTTTTTTITTTNKEPHCRL